VEYDIQNNDIKTVSLHYFEDEYLREGRVSFSTIPEIKLEPQQRCASLLVYDSKLVILPFKQEKSVLEFSQEERFLMDEDKQEKQEEKDDAPVKRQVIVDLKKLGLHVCLSDQKLTS
jgi:cleavage and polyadenylation specificity factor subunit 1